MKTYKNQKFIRYQNQFKIMVNAGVHVHFNLAIRSS